MHQKKLQLLDQITNQTIVNLILKAVPNHGMIECQELAALKNKLKWQISLNYSDEIDFFLECKTLVIGPSFYVRDATSARTKAIFEDVMFSIKGEAKEFKINIQQQLSCELTISLVFLESKLAECVELTKHLLSQKDLNIYRALSYAGLNESDLVTSVAVRLRNS